MKQYLKLETCKRLVAMGCTSQSDMYFLEGFGDEVHHNTEGGGCCNPSFEFEDFAGTSEHAVANAKIVFSDESFESVHQDHGSISIKNNTMWIERRKDMCREKANWTAIIEAALGEDN